METTTNKIKLKIIITSSLMIICFFLPWIEIQLLTSKISYSGWDMPKVAMNISNIISAGNRFLGTEYNFTIGNSIYILYLIPVLSGLLIYLAYEETYKYVGHIELVIFAIIGYLSYRIYTSENFDSSIMGIGLVGTMGLGVFMLLDGIKKFNTKTNKEKKERITEGWLKYDKYLLWGGISVFALYLILNYNPEPVSPDTDFNYNPYANGQSYNGVTMPEDGDLYTDTSITNNIEQVNSEKKPSKWIRPAGKDAILKEHEASERIWQKQQENE